MSRLQHPFEWPRARWPVGKHWIFCPDGLVTPLSDAMALRVTAGAPVAVTCRCADGGVAYRMSAPPDAFNSLGRHRGAMVSG